VKQKIDALFEEWQQAADPRMRDQILAEALGGEVTHNGEPLVRWHHEGRPESEPLPPYTTNLNAATQAMNQAWDALEEIAPHKIHCQRDPAHPHQRGDCFIEWWPDEETHVFTPRFSAESEARAFAAFAFARLQREV